MGSSRNISDEANGPREESSAELSSLAANVLGYDEVTDDDVDAEMYNALLKDAKRLAGSVLSQDETPKQKYAQPCDEHEYIESGCPNCGKMA